MSKHARQGLLAAGFLLSLTCIASVQTRPAPAAGHSPVTENRASMETMQIPSHGKGMNALVYVAAGVGPHPAVILLHGFPGNERNLDLAQDIRRAGWDVLYFNYRGSWGTPGDFSFTHGIEDVAAALAYLRQPAVANKLRLDPARIVLVGHSMGGFMAIQAAAADPRVRAIGVISGGDLGGVYQHLRRENASANATEKMATGLAHEGMAPLHGCTADGLAQQVAAHAADWVFTAKAAALRDRNVLVVTSDDGLADYNEAFADALRKAGDRHVTTRHLSTDHAYSDMRTDLSKTVLAWLAGLAQ
ncbi:alpha/beta hydrolase family protein [Frateuria sp. YIM B11624]|uniref:alpha/beta hydrolase family protein n=1 Tax=Frateuria sp. YIM B11624 TaxID=3143185 RepID=UPI003C71C839